MWHFFSINPNLTNRNPKKEFITKIDRTTNNIKKTIEENLSIISSENLRTSVASYDLFWEDKPALWISIDGKNLIEVENSQEKIFNGIFKSVNNSTDKNLTKLIFEIRWPLIILVTKIQGKCLTGGAWIINSNTFLSRASVDKLNLLNFATQKLIPMDVLSELKIKVWDIPQLEVATRFIQNMVKLSLQIASIKDLKRLPFLDDQGVDQFKIYATKLMGDIKLEIQIILSSAEEMKNFLMKLSYSDDHIYPNMSELDTILNEVIKYLTSVSNSLDEIELEQKTLFEWVDKLDGWKFCVIYASNAYLFWVSYVISSSV